MKHIGKELYRIIDEKRLKKSDIAKQIDMDPSYFNQLMHRRSIDAEKLEEISKVIGISPCYFFDDWQLDKYTIVEINNATVVGDATVNIGYNAKSLKDQLADKERIIAEKERLIKVLSIKAGIEL